MLAGVSAIEFMEQVSILSIVSKNLKIYGNCKDRVEKSDCCLKKGKVKIFFEIIIYMSQEPILLWNGNFDYNNFCPQFFPVLGHCSWSLLISQKAILPT